MQGPRKFNFRSDPDSRLAISPDTIPTLVPAESLKLFQDGDAEPYFKIQAIPYPSKANGCTYTEEFWKSYINKLATRPIPGSSRGHETRWGARGPTDLLLVGAKLEPKGDGAGIVYLKNYIPPCGESGDNSMFIKQNKAGMLDYSIVSYTRDEISTLPDGSREVRCVESLRGERNDCVDYDTGAMEMKTNAEGRVVVNQKCITFVRSCIASGKLDSSSAWSFSGSDGTALLGTDGEDWTNFAKYHLAEDQGATEDTKARWKYPVGKNGKVYRSALRAIASRAAQQSLSEISDTASSLIKEIDEKKRNAKGNRMDREELLKLLGTMKANGEITLMDCAKAMGLEKQIRSEADADNEVKLNALKTELGDGDLAVKVKALKANAAVAEEAAREKAVSEIPGIGPKQNADGKPNVRFDYAMKQVVGLSGEKLNAAIEGLKKDEIMLQLNAQEADVTSKVNRLDQKDGGQQAAAFEGAAVEL